MQIAGVALTAAVLDRCSPGSELPPGFVVETGPEVNPRYPLVISPAGDQILFTKAGGLFEAPQQAILNLSDRTEVTIGTTGLADEAVWSENRALWVRRDMGWGKSTLYRVDKNGRDILQIGETGQEYHAGIAVSPDGQSIVFSRKQGDRYVLFVRGVDSRERRISSSSQTDEIYPVWSPDGKFIAFIGRKQDGWFATSSLIQVYNTETGNITQLTDLKTRDDGDSVPVWSPDSRKLAFYDEKGMLVVAGREGEIISHLTDLEFTFSVDRHRRANWSASGQYLAFETYHKYKLNKNTYYDTYLILAKADGSFCVALTDDLDDHEAHQTWRQNQLAFVENGQIKLAQTTDGLPLAPHIIPQPAALYTTGDLKYLPDGRLVFVGSSTDYSSRIIIFTPVSR